MNPPRVRDDIHSMTVPTAATGFKNLFNAPAEGMRRGIQQATAAGERIANGEITPDNMIDLLEAKFVVKANAAVTRSANEMIGSFLDILA